MKKVEELIEVFSPNRLSTLAVCHYRFFRQYVMEEKRPKTPALAFGNAWDETTNICYQESMEEGIPFTNKRKAKDVFAWQWDQEKEEVEDWGVGEKPGEIQHAGLKLASLWTAEVASELLPVKVQASWEVSWQEIPWRVRGVMDLIAKPIRQKKLILVDNKTARRRWKRAKSLYSLQAPAYSLAAQSLLGEEIDEFYFHVAIRKKNPEIQVEWVNVDQKAKQQFIRKVAFARKLVQDLYKSGVWLPTGRDSQHFLCSRKYCPYWQECEKEWGGEVAD